MKLLSHETTGCFDPNYTVFHLLSQVTERHETVMAQLMSGDPKNQNIPGLDAILRGEVLRKDALIAQLMNQGNNQSGFLPNLLRD